MSKKTSKVLVALLFGVGSAAYAENDFTVSFSNGSLLVFSEPLTTGERSAFGDGWKSAAYIKPKGKSQPLFSSEVFASGNGVIYDTTQTRVSKTGRYMVIDILRVGTVDSGPDGQPFVDSKEYCPVLDTTSGCISSINSGAICGGKWDVLQDKWLDSRGDSSSTDGMIKNQLSTPQALWSNYFAAKDNAYHYALKQAVSDNLGVDNMLRCAMVDTGNANSYKMIAEQLRIEGDKIDADKLKLALEEFGDRNSEKNAYRVTVQKAFLFDEPNTSSQTKAYLVKGDRVKSLDRAHGDWIYIEYSGSSGKLRKWMLSNALD